MKQSRKKHSAAIPILLGIIATLVVLLGIMVYTVIRQQFQSERPVAAFSNTNSEAANTSGYPAAYQIQFEQEWKVNQDFKGYLTLEGTALSTNVVQGTDNSFYRDHGFDGGTESRIAFLDYRADIEIPSKQLLIYLPHANNHRKYGELVNFKNLEYYKEHPVINFNSLYRNAKYKIFAVALFPSGYDGIPFQSCMETNDKTQFVTLVQKAMEHSILQIPVDVWDTDELLIVMSEDLSLMDENGKYARIAVFARKIRDGESETVNTQKAAINPNVQMPEQFVLNPSSMIVLVNDSYNIKASSEVQTASSSNPDVARVSISKDLVNVFGVSPGEATVTVTGKNGMSATCKVTIKKYQLTFDKTSLDMKTGNRRNIYVSTGAAANWYVDNSSVVKMSIVENGKAVLVEAIGTGTATVTATARNGAQASCKITVNGSGVALSTTYMDLNKGELKDLRVTRGEVAKWEVANKDVADVYVIGDGSFAQVEGRGYGSTTIKAIGTDGSVATLNVNVSAPNESLTITPYSMTVTQGELRNITVTSGNATNWVSSNPNVAEVYVVGDGSVAQVQGKNPGNATITVYDSQGGWVNCNVTVEARASKLVIGPGTVHMNVGDWEDLSVISGKVVDWTSSNSNVVARMDGVIGNASATITVGAETIYSNVLAVTGAIGIGGTAGVSASVAVVTFNSDTYAGITNSELSAEEIYIQSYVDNTAKAYAMSLAGGAVGVNGGVAVVTNRSTTNTILDRGNYTVSRSLYRLQKTFVQNLFSPIHPDQSCVRNNS